MKARIDSLAQEFTKHQSSLYGSKYENICKNKDLLQLFASLGELIQSPSFFETLFQDGFHKSEEYWTFVSPIIPLLNTYFDLARVAYSNDSNVWRSTYIKELDDFHSEHNPFYCEQNLWRGTNVRLDKVTSQWLVSHQSEGEVFLGITEGRPVEGGHKEIIRQLQSSPSQKMTALLYLCNGVYVEPYFFIKTEEQITVLGSSSGYTHHEMVGIMREHHIIQINSPDVPLVHDGNCAVHSELNLNSVLYEALERNNSVYDAVDALRKKECSLGAYRVSFRDLMVTPQPAGPIPDDPTLARLLAILSLVSLTLGSKGWVEFCKARGIHPKHALKSTIQDWYQFQDPIWQDASLLQSYLEDKASPGEPASVPNPVVEPSDQDSDEPLQNEIPFPEPSVCIAQMKRASPSLRQLYTNIEALAQHAKTMGADEKATLLEEHVETLQDTLDDFLYESARNGLTQGQEQKFKTDFARLLHSEDPVMDSHRAIWKPIVANVFISLTGIGFLALMVKVIAHATDSNKEHFSLNKALFFAETKSQLLAQEIDQSLEALTC